MGWIRTVRIPRKGSEIFFKKYYYLFQDHAENICKKGTRTGEVDEVVMKSAMNDILNKIVFIRKSADIQILPKK